MVLQVTFEKFEAVRKLQYQPCELWCDATGQQIQYQPYELWCDASGRQIQYQPSLGHVRYTTTQMANDSQLFQ